MPTPAAPARLALSRAMVRGLFRAPPMPADREQAPLPLSTILDLVQHHSTVGPGVLDEVALQLSHHLSLRPERDAVLGWREREHLQQRLSAWPALGAAVAALGVAACDTWTASVRATRVARPERADGYDTEDADDLLDALGALLALPEWPGALTAPVVAALALAPDLWGDLIPGLGDHLETAAVWLEAWPSALAIPDHALCRLVSNTGASPLLGLDVVQRRLLAGDLWRRHPPLADALVLHLRDPAVWATVVAGYAAQHPARAARCVGAAIAERNVHALSPDVAAQLLAHGDRASRVALLAHLGQAAVARPLPTAEATPRRPAR